MLLNAISFSEKNFNIGKYVSFTLSFKTSELNGVIISGSESTAFPAISLEILDGKVSRSSLWRFHSRELELLLKRVIYYDTN